MPKFWCQVRENEGDQPDESKWEEVERGSWLNTHEEAVEEFVDELFDHERGDYGLALGDEVEVFVKGEDGEVMLASSSLEVEVRHHVWVEEDWD